MQLQIEEDTFENVYIYVSDALRYDAVPESLSNRWEPIKTVSGGTASPTGFGTIVTGLYPTHHGVTGWESRLSEDIFTIFDLFENSVFHRGGGQIGEVLGTTRRIPDYPLTDAESPFLLMERDLVTHAPFGETFEMEDREFETHLEYWQSRKGNVDQIKADYRRGAEFAVERFENRLDDLRQREILEETLVIFTADHGELLGEYGFVGHGKLACPELVYVPTLFCVDADPQHTTDTAISHLDLIPTIASIFDVSLPANKAYPGADLTQSVRDDRIHYNHSAGYRSEVSAWDASGGYVFSGDSLFDRVAWFGGQISRLDSRYFVRRHLWKAFRHSITGANGVKTFREPGFSEAEAKELIEGVRTEQGLASQQTISQEGRERLERLGYLKE
jgi:hypothetical protein